MDKKYQIFISSTYEDLKQEREKAIKAILEMGHIPVGMEMFSAADEEQWKLIARQIKDSDYYILLAAHRYGSETPEGLSYTEKEYDYAREQGVPTLSFIINDSAPWPANLTDNDHKKKAKLVAFKQKAKTKLVQFWSNQDDLQAKIIVSLTKAMSANPRIGWTRTSELIEVEVTKELSRLSSENSELRKEIEKLRASAIEQVDEVRNVIHIMYENDRKIRVRKTSDWSSGINHDTTLLDIFHATAPNLINEASSLEFAKNIALSLVGTGYHKNWPIGSNITSGILADLVALDVIEPSKKKHSVTDENSYWSLTRLGKQVLKRARRVQLEEGIRAGENNSPKLKEDESSTISEA